MARTLLAILTTTLLVTVGLLGALHSAAPSTGGARSPIDGASPNAPALTAGATLSTPALQSDEAPSDSGEGTDPLLWLNHFDLLPGGDEVTTTHASTSSGVGGGLTALVIQSSTTGDTFSDGGNKVVHMAVSVPPGFNVTAVRVCFELSSNESFITQVRLAQVNDPPSFALVLLDDGTNLTDVGPVCVDTSGTSIDPSLGALLLSLRLDFGNTSDKVAIRGLGLHLVAASPAGILWLNHFDFLSGGAQVTTTFRSTTSGVGGGLTGLVIESSTTGEVFADGGNKVVQMAVSVPPGFVVTAVRVCYELTSNESFLSQVRLAQVQNPPSSALVLLDDGTDLTGVGPLCTDTSATSVNPSLGALLLSMRVNFGNTSDKIVVRGVALVVANSVASLSANLENFVAGMDPSDFSNKNHKKTFLNKIDALQSQIDGGDLCAAMNKLTNDLLAKTDGEGSPPDWVVDATAQQALEDLILALIEALEAEAGAAGLDCGTDSAILWLNHFDLLSGGSEVTTSHASTSSGVGGGLTGLVIESSTTGDVYSDGGNKVVHMAVEVPAGYHVTAVRICYELTSNASFISQVRLAQVNDPPSFALVLLDDGTNQTDAGPICVDTSATSIDPSSGALLLSLRVDFGSTSDKIVVRGLALLLSTA